MMSVAEAEAIILNAMPPAPVREVPLAGAYGAVLRAPVAADRDFPPYDRVAMDGIALREADWRAGARQFRLAGMQRAGVAATALTEAGGCIEVMTGAVLPAGCDSVVPVEQLTIAGGVATLAAGTVVEPGQNVHRRGSDRPAGAPLLAPGTRLWAPQLAVAASVGQASLPVSRTPRIALIATGDELVPIAASPLPHQVRRSNGPSLGAALVGAGFADVRDLHAPDDPAAIAQCLREALADSAFVILSGGVSEGRFDHVPAVLAALGVGERLHKVAQRPGKPLWFGMGPAGQAVFGLPGNPVSAAVCFYRYVMPALWRHLGLPATQPPRAVLARDVAVRKPLTLFQPVRVSEDAAGRRLATPVALNGSGDLVGLAQSDGVLELAGGGRTFAAGEAHPLWLWAS